MPDDRTTEGKRKMKDSIVEKTKEDGTGRGCMDKCKVN